MLWRIKSRTQTDWLMWHRYDYIYIMYNIVLLIYVYKEPKGKEEMGDGIQWKKSRWFISEQTRLLPRPWACSLFQPTRPLHPSAPAWSDDKPFTPPLPPYPGFIYISRRLVFVSLRLIYIYIPSPPAKSRLSWPRLDTASLVNYCLGCRAAIRVAFPPHI